MRRGYLDRAGRRVHALAGGRGPLLLCLHALPQSALSLRELATALSRDFAVLVPDLPGCGLSDPLPGETADLDAVALDLLAVVDGLGGGGFAVYADGNSAALAMALLRRSGGRIRQVVLDDPRRVAPGEAAAFVAACADDFAPEPSGAHLVRLWDRVRTDAMFRYPHRLTAAERLDRDMPDAAALTQRVLGWLAAGPRARGWFEALARDAAAAPAEATGDRVPIVELGADAVAGRSGTPVRARAIREALQPAEPAAALDLDAPAFAPASGPGPSRTFLPVQGGFLHAQVLGLDRPGRPVISLHDPAGTSELVLSFSAPLAASRPVIALDLPGNGESDNTLGTDEPTSADYARVVGEAVDSLGLREIDLIGRYSGGPIGMELSFQRPGLVRHLVQAGITTYDPEEARRLLERYTPSIQPRDDGGHLLLAWHIMKSQALFWPWFDQTRAGVIRGEPQLDPALIHRRVVDLLKCGDLYRKAYAALWTYPLEARLPRVDVPTLLCAPAWDPLYPHLGKAAAAGPQCQVATLPARFGDWQQCFEAFFGGG